MLGVQQQVEDDLLNLLAVHGHEWQVVAVVLVELDVRVQELVLPQRDRAPHDVVHVEGRSLRRRTAHERQQVPDDLRSAIRL